MNKKNILFVCHQTKKEWLYSTSCIVKDVNWILPQDYNIPEKCTAKFRYRQPDQDVYLKYIDSKTVILSYPQKIASVTCGQEAVFYDGNICMGGGVIEQVFIDDVDLNEKILMTYKEKLNGKH